MRRLIVNTVITKTAVAALALACFSALHAAEPEDLIKYRQSVMKSIGGHMGAIAAIVQGKVDYDHLAAHAAALNTTSQLVKDIFPEDSAVGETEAKQAIWDQHDDFVQAVEKLEQGAAEFQQAADGGGDLGAALKGLGGACKNCHDDFRQKKE